MKFIGLLIIFMVLPIDFWWFYKRRKRIASLISVSLLALFVGLCLTFCDRIIEITINKVGTIKIAAAQATSDASEIARIKQRVEAQSATIDLVAKTASEAKSLSDSLAAKNQEAARKIAHLDSSLLAAATAITNLQLVTEYTTTANAAFFDDRLAYDQLIKWAQDPTHPFQKQADQTLQVIMDEHNRLEVYKFGLPSSFSEEQLSKLTLPQLQETYASQPGLFRRAILQRITDREDIPKAEKMQYFVTIMKTDHSLYAVQQAGTEFAKLAGFSRDVNPMAYRFYISWWDANKDSLK